MKNIIKANDGQVLLITILLLATALTVVLSASFRSTTETQTTKLQEDSQKALAAAEAGIEKALKEGLTDAGGTSLNFNLDNGASSNVIATTAQPQEHSISLNQDEQYTLYLADIQNDTPDIPNLIPAYNGNLTICFTGNVGLEMTTITKNKPSGYTVSVRRTAVDSNSTKIINGAYSPSVAAPADCPTKDGVNFNHKYLLTVSRTDDDNGDILLIVRAIGAGTTVGFKAAGALPFQGKTYISTGSTGTGATKRVQFFQSFPQIPSDFFVTSF